MPFTQISSTNIQPNTVVSAAEYAAFTANVLPKISSVQYADATFTALDDTAANTSGTARLVINGSGFQTGATVIVGTTTASSTARVSTEQLRANVSALSAGSYTMYVQNPDGGTAIRVNGVTFSNTPVWGTAAALSNQAANTAFAVSISANSDSNVTYSNTTSLPAGTSLLSNGYFYGTVTVGVETAFTFDVRATDAENQDNSRTFSLTVTVGPPPSQLWLWGDNRYALLGLNDTTYRSSPVQLGSGSDWALVSGGRYCTAAIKTDGTLWVWGNNEIIVERVNRSSPVQVGATTNWSKVAAGDASIYAIKTDGTLWSWGVNSYGNLGLNAAGNYARRSSPTQIGTDTTWSEISAGRFSVSAIKTNGTLWTWGTNPRGQLGLNDRTYRSSPTQVGSSTDWSKSMSGSQSGFAIKTNGTLWAWGNNNGGHLGVNDTVARSSPTQIGTNTNWSEVAASRHNAWNGTEKQPAAAIKTDGTLWTWGTIEAGVQGLNISYPSTLYRSSPTQVGSNTTWSKIGVGRLIMVATKTDGTLWSWGDNGGGQLGFNERFNNKSSPTQVGSSTNWNLVSIGFGAGGSEQVFVTKKI